MCAEFVTARVQLVRRTIPHEGMSPHVAVHRVDDMFRRKRSCRGCSCIVRAITTASRAWKDQAENGWNPQSHKRYKPITYLEFVLPIRRDGARANQWIDHCLGAARAHGRPL